MYYGRDFNGTYFPDWIERLLTRSYHYLPPWYLWAVVLFAFVMLVIPDTTGKLIESAIDGFTVTEQPEHHPKVTVEVHVEP